MLGTNSIASTPIASSNTAKFYELLFTVYNSTSSFVNKVVNKTFNTEFGITQTSSKGYIKNFITQIQLTSAQLKNVSKIFTTSIGLNIDILIKALSLTFFTYFEINSDNSTKHINKRFNVTNSLLSSGIRQFSKSFKVVIRPISRFIFGLDDPAFRTNIWYKYNHIVVNKNAIEYLNKHIIAVKDYVKHIISIK